VTSAEWRGVLGTSEEAIRQPYGHHSIEHLRRGNLTVAKPMA
jgi:hypothetical protein